MDHPKHRSTSTSASAEVNDATRSRSTLHAVDNTDWLKTAAIILVAVDHFGHFFVEHDEWWSVLGRLAAPIFFFLVGYAQTRTVPLHWIWLGVILTLLESWNANWAWVAPNILFSLALIRIARPYVQTLLQRYGWIAFALIGSALIAVLPVAGQVVDYGAEGWLWALFGVCHRMYVDGRSATGGDGAAQISAPSGYPMAEKADQMRILACLLTAAVYVWQEQREYAFPQMQLAGLVLGVGALSLSLCLFQRGPSRIQPPGAIAAILHFIGRHTLEIYAAQLACFELIAKLAPGLTP